MGNEGNHNNRRALFNTDTHLYIQPCQKTGGSILSGAIVGLHGSCAVRRPHLPRMAPLIIPIINDIRPEHRILPCLSTLQGGFN